MQAFERCDILRDGLSSILCVSKGDDEGDMEFLLVSVLVLMLLGVAYAQWQRGVVRTIGKLSLDEEDTDKTVR
jgi:hypothetical protein